LLKASVPKSPCCSRRAGGASELAPASLHGSDSARP
jgi:hypothetical protein